MSINFLRETRTYGHLWQQEDHADVEVVLVGPQQGSNEGDGGTCKLAAFPGHGLLLSDSPFLKAQILRWQNKRQHEAAFGNRAQPAWSAVGRVGYSSSGTGSSKAQIVLSLEDADQQPAALAVLQSLYQNKLGTGLFADLTQEQLLQAALLADMWQVQDVSSAAATALSAAADGQLSEAVTQKLLLMQAVPACLEPLLKKVLLSVFGDLEAVWADAALLKQLLGLPLHAIKLLLSCDELKVASEHTVLYTVRRFTGELRETPALQQLMRLVRCPHLSPYWLSALAMSSIPVPAELLPHVRKLLAARSIKADCKVTADDLFTAFKDAPCCWAAPKRAIQPVSSVQVTWDVPIEQIREAAQRSAADSARVKVQSPCRTPPIDGTAYDLSLECKPDGSSCFIGLFGAPADVPADLCWSCEFTFIASGTHARTVSKPMYAAASRWGSTNLFQLPAMAGGWDEAVWAAKGLPTSGTLPITLTVFAQSQQQAAAAPPVAVPTPSVANTRRGRGRGRRR